MKKHFPLFRMPLSAVLWWMYLLGVAPVGGFWCDTFDDKAKIDFSEDTAAYPNALLMGERFRPWPGNPLSTLESCDPWNSGGNPRRQIPGATHPDVLFFPLGLDGYKFWMVFTPFGPVPRGESGSADWYYERPSLVRSHDGIRWEKTADYSNPLIGPGQAGEWDGDFIADPDLVYAPGRGSNEPSWFLYYQGWVHKRGVIGLAVSRDGKHYTKRGPIMPATTRCPAVVYDSEQKLFRAWYNWGLFEVGYATSTNGMNWTPYNPEAPGKWGYVVYRGTPGTYDQGGVSHMDVIRLPEAYHMYYLAMPTRDYAGLVIGHATSPDGIHWIQQPVPALQLNDEAWLFWRGKRKGTKGFVKSFYRPGVVAVGSNLFMYYGGVDQYNAYPAENCDVGLAFSTEAGHHIALAPDGRGLHKPSGSITSVPIAPPRLEKWQRFHAHDLCPPGTIIRYSILDKHGKTLLPSVQSGDDISSLGSATIRLRAQLVTPDPALTPELHDWSLVVKLRQKENRPWPLAVARVKNLARRAFIPITIVAFCFCVALYYALRRRQRRRRGSMTEQTGQ